MQKATETTPSGPSAPSQWPTSPKLVGPEAVRARQREKILKGTVELVAKRGYHGSSAERICKVAGVSFPTFRKHFRDKEEAFLAAFDKAVAEVQKRAAEAADAAGDDWAQRIAAGLRAVLEAIQDDPAVAKLVLVEALSAGPAGIDRYEEAVRLCVPALAEGRELAGSTELPPLLEETIAGGVAWTVHQKVAVGEAREAMQLYKDLLQTILTPYLGEEAARAIAERPVRA